MRTIGVLLTIVAGILAEAPRALSAAETKIILEDRVAALEKTVKLQNDVLTKLQAQLAILEKQPRVLKEGLAVVPVHKDNHGRLQVRLPADLGFDAAKDRILLTSQLSHPGRHNYLPLLDAIQKDGFTIHVADVQSTIFESETVPVHWIIIRQP